MMKAGGVEIHAKPGNRTGLSALSGGKVESPADLPPHLVEAHLFVNADAAAAFVDGMLAAGLGNNLAYDWEPGTSASNRTVLIARLDEERPAGEAVKVVEHGRTGHDGEAYRRSMEEIHARRRADHAKQEAAAKPVRAALGELSPRDIGLGSGWYRCSLSGEQAVMVTWKQAGGPFDVGTVCAETGEGPLDLTETYVSVAAKSGVAYDADEREFGKRGVLLGDLVAAVRDISQAERECLEAKKAAYQEDFMSRMKMTPSRRRFLEAGRASGVRVHVNRGNRKARAGGYEIGATEIATLEKAGWIESGTGGYAVTEAGAAALDGAAGGLRRSVRKP